MEIVRRKLTLVTIGTQRFKGCSQLREVVAMGELTVLKILEFITTLDYQNF